MKINIKNGILALLLTMCLSASVLASETVQTAYGMSLTTGKPNSDLEVFRIDNGYWDGTVSIYNGFVGIPLDKDLLIVSDASGKSFVVHVGENLVAADLKPPVKFRMIADEFSESEASLSWTFNVTSFSPEKIGTTFSYRISDEQLIHMNTAHPMYSSGLEIGQIGDFQSFPYPKVKVKATAKFFDNFDYGRCLKIGLGHHNDTHFFNVAETNKVFPPQGSHDTQFSLPMTVKASSYCEPGILKRKTNQENPNHDVTITIQSIDLVSK